MNRQPMTTLSHDVVLECADPWGRTTGVRTTLTYRSEDPYAVGLTFHAGSGDVEWLLARNLLSRGLLTPIGDGDVRVFPSIGEDGRAVTVLVFSSPDGRLLAELASDDLQAFLTRTFQLVPAGRENDHLDVDALIDGLLSQAE